MTFSPKGWVNRHLIVDHNFLVPGPAEKSRKKLYFWTICVNLKGRRGVYSWSAFQCVYSCLSIYLFVRLSACDVYLSTENQHHWTIWICCNDILVIMHCFFPSPSWRFSIQAYKEIPVHLDLSSSLQSHAMAICSPHGWQLKLNRVQHGLPRVVTRSPKIEWKGPSKTSVLAR